MIQYNIVNKNKQLNYAKIYSAKYRKKLTAEEKRKYAREYYRKKYSIPKKLFRV